MFAGVLESVKKGIFTEEEDFLEAPANVSLAIEDSAIQNIAKTKLAFLSIYPVSFGEAQSCAKELIAGKALIISFENLPGRDKQRVFDYLNGICYIIKANVDKISKETLLYVPSGSSIEKLDLSRASSNQTFKAI